MRIKKKAIGSRDKQGKLEVMDREINDGNNKISEVKATISALKSKAGGCYDVAEETNADIATLVVMGNRFRKAAKEKEKSLQELENAVDNLNKLNEIYDLTLPCGSQNRKNSQKYILDLCTT